MPLLSKFISAIALAITAIFGSSACSKPTPPKPTVLIYGDSLTAMSETTAHYFHDGKENLVFRAFPGTAACTWAPEAKLDAATIHPTRVVLAFTGNSTSCAPDTSQDVFLASYKAAVEEFRVAFGKTPITLVLSPVMDDKRVGVPHTNGMPALNALYVSLSEGGSDALPNVDFNPDALLWLTPGNKFRASGPAYPGNGPVVPLRTPDGVHLTIGGQDYYGVVLGE